MLIDLHGERRREIDFSVMQQSGTSWSGSAKRERDTNKAPEAGPVGCERVKLFAGLKAREDPPREPSLQE